MSRNNPDKWIDDIREKERNFEIPAPEGLWADIECHISDHAKKRNVLLPFKKRYIGAAAAIALVALLTGRFFIMQYTAPADAPLINAQYAYIKSTSSTNNAADDGDISSEHVERRRAIPGHNPSYKTDAYKGINMPERFLENMPVSDSAKDIEITDTKKDTPSETLPETCPDANDTYLNTPAYDNLYPAIRRNEKVRGISISAYTGNLMASSSATVGGFSPASAILSNTDTYSNASLGENTANDIMIMNKGKLTDTKTTHHLPLRFGLSIDIPLTNRLSIESGITYSYLSSTITSGTEANFFDTKQTLHYLGVPVKLNYAIWSNHRFGVYIVAGGMIEKCVAGRADTDYIMGGLLTDNTLETVRERRPQWSVSAGAGAKYQLTRHLNIYIEPSASYYFDNHSRVENSYKGHPMNFDFKIGLRYNLRH